MIEIRPSSDLWPLLFINLLIVLQTTQVRKTHVRHPTEQTMYHSDRSENLLFRMLVVKLVCKIRHFLMLNYRHQTSTH